MIAAGGLIGLNLHERFDVIEGGEGSGDLVGEIYFGFPMKAKFTEGLFWESQISEEELRKGIQEYDHESKLFYAHARVILGRGIFLEDGSRKFRPIGIAVDGAFGLAVLVAVGCVSEWVIRRKKKSNENQPAIN